MKRENPYDAVRRGEVSFVDALTPLEASVLPAARRQRGALELYARRWRAVGLLQRPAYRQKICVR